MRVRVITLLVLCGLAGLFPIASAGAEKNLLANSGFEQGKANWQAEWEKTCFSDRGVTHGGAASLKIMLPEGRHHITVGQTIKVKPGTRYMVGGWSKSDGGAYTYFIVWFRDDKGKYLKPPYRSGGLVKHAHPWTESSFVFRVPPGAASMIVKFGIKRPGATGWFDDLYLKEVAASHVENHVVNSGFEIERTPGYPVGWNRTGYKRERRYFGAGYWGLDRTTAFHGKQSLKVAAPLITRSIWCKGGLSYPYTFSIYLKSNRPELKCRIAVRRNRKTVTVGRSWKRYSMTINKCRANPVVSFTPLFSHDEVDLKKGPVLWADAAQVELGEAAQAYTPAARIATALLPPQKKKSKSVQIVFRTGDRNMFPANGTMVAGRPFIPYWVWGLTLEDSASLKPWGINCAFSRELDKVERLGLKAWLCPPHPRLIKNIGRKKKGTQTREEVLASVNEAVRKHRDHPALLGYFMCDEPSGSLTPGLIGAFYQTIKKIDPVHPAFFNWGIHADTWKYKDRLKAKFQYAGATDILCGDPYPVPYVPIDSMARMTDAFIREAKGRPVFMVPQFFGDVANHPAAPTPEEETGMIYLSLIHGTRGFCFYSRRPVSTPLWQSMLRAGKEIKELAPVLFSSEPTGLSGQTPDGYGSGIHCLPRRYKGNLYLITANAEFRDVRTKFALPGLKARSKIKLLFENRSVRSGAGSFSDLFGPYQRHVYEIPKGSMP